MFVTFEGIDGCGKTTQIKIIADYLEKKGYRVVLIREPGGTDFSENIRKILLESKHAISGTSELLLFNAARANLTETVIKPALAEGAVVLSDRFFDSTTAYQGYGRGLSAEYVQCLNLFATGGLVPDITFFLDVDLDTAHARSAKRRPDRIENSGDDFFERVIEGFRKISAENPDRIVTIHSEMTIDETSRHIIDILERALSAGRSK